MDQAERYRNEMEAIFQETDAKLRLHQLTSPREEFKASLRANKRLQRAFLNSGYSNAEAEAEIEAAALRRFPVE